MPEVARPRAAVVTGRKPFLKVVEDESGTPRVRITIGEASELLDAHQARRLAEELLGRARHVERMIWARDAKQPDMFGREDDKR